MKVSLRIAAIIFVFSFLAACSGQAEPQTFTIGVVNLVPTFDFVFDGFKDGMEELGYIEGENMTYIYEGATSSIEALEPVVANLLAVDVDLIFTISTPALLVTQRSVSETDTPVVFSLVHDPVASGVLESLREPNGNITGIKVGGNISKALEWHLAIAPETNVLFVPHNPDEGNSVLSLAELEEVSDVMGIELVIDEVRTSEEISASLAEMPTNVDAIFLLPIALIIDNVEQFVDIAVERQIPLSDGANQYRAGSILSYAPDFFSVGHQTSHLVDSILQGTPVAELPVETVDFFLGINLQAAAAIGLTIPDEVLEQADVIIRED